MKLPNRMMDKVKEKETLIREKLGDDFYEWVIDPETEIKDFKVIAKIRNVLMENTTD